MNVIVSNEKSKELTALDIDVIKSITGEYNTDELISMFKTFFYEKMIIDVTAIRNYNEINNVERLAMGLGADKIVLLLTDELCTSIYLSGLIDVGIYNFTNNINAIKRLIARPNTFEDVQKLQLEAPVSNSSGDSDSDNSSRKFKASKIIGFKNLTSHAGATTLIYMILKELKKSYGMGVYALEIDKKDFIYFNNKDMHSVASDQVKSELNQLSNAKVILIDLNDYNDTSICSEVIYLLEPSTIKLNNLIRKDSKIFEKLKGKKIVLNRSMLSNKDVTEFEYESNSRIFYNIPCLDDRADNHNLIDFLARLGLIDSTGARQADKIFGIFKR